MENFLSAQQNIKNKTHKFKADQHMLNDLKNQITFNDTTKQTRRHDKPTTRRLIREQIADITFFLMNLEKLEQKASMGGKERSKHQRFNSHELDQNVQRWPRSVL